MTAETTFDEWLAELGRLAAADGCAGYLQQTGSACWMDAYESGETPADAWEDEKSCAAEDFDGAAENPGGGEQP